MLKCSWRRSIGLQRRVTQAGDRGQAAGVVSRGDWLRRRQGSHDNGGEVRQFCSMRPIEFAGLDQILDL
jgi:hypothetical protein